MIKNTFLINQNNLNILINNKTGKWLSFLSDENDKNDETIISKKIDKTKLIRMYGNKLSSLLISNMEEMKQPFGNNQDKVKMNCLILNITEKCNMKCKYCYAHAKDDAIMMSAETIEMSIRKFAKNIYPDKLTVIFHGGEPLLGFDNIKKALENLNDVDNLLFSLQTNGILLDENKIRFFKSKNFTVGLSFDGINEKNNSLRNIDSKINDFSNRNIKLITAYKDTIKPLMVIHEKNIHDLDKIVLFFQKNNIEKVVCNLLWTHDLSNCVDNNLLFEKMKCIVDTMFDNYKNGEFLFSERDIRMLIRKILYGKLNEYMCMNSPCGAGKETVVVVPNGDVFGCNVLLPDKEKKNYMGNIFKNDVNEILRKEILICKRDINKIEGCKNCPYKVLCSGGGCCGFIYLHNNDVNGTTIYCDYHFKLITYIIKKALITSGEYALKNY